MFDLTLENDGWSMINVTEDGLSQRATARFSDDDTVDVTGQRSTDAGVTWEPDFTMTLTRDPVITASAATLIKQGCVHVLQRSADRDGQ